MTATSQALATFMLIFLSWMFFSCGTNLPTTSESSSKLMGVVDGQYFLRLAPQPPPQNHYRFETCTLRETEVRCVPSFTSKEGQPILFTLESLSLENLPPEDLKNIEELGTGWQNYRDHLATRAPQIMDTTLKIGLAAGSSVVLLNELGLIRRKKPSKLEPYEVAAINKAKRQALKEKRLKKKKFYQMRKAQSFLTKNNFSHSFPVPLEIPRGYLVYSEDFIKYMESKGINPIDFGMDPTEAAKKAKTSIAALIEQFHLMKGHNQWSGTALEIISPKYQKRFMAYVAAQKNFSNNPHDLGKFARWNHTGFIKHLRAFFIHKGVSPKILTKVKAAWPYGLPLAPSPTTPKKGLFSLPGKKLIGFVIIATAGTGAYYYLKPSSEEGERGHHPSPTTSKDKKLLRNLKVVIHQSHALFGDHETLVSSVLEVQEALGVYIQKIITESEEEKPNPHAFCYPGLALQEVTCQVISL